MNKSLLILYILVLLSLGVNQTAVVSFVSADDEKIDKELSKIEEKKEELEKKQSSLSERLSNVKEEAENIKGLVDELASDISVNQAQVDSLTAQIQNVDAELDALQHILENKRETLGLQETRRDQTVRTLYKAGRTSVPLNILNSRDFSGTLKTAEYQLRVINDAMDFIESLNTEINATEEQKAEVESIRDSLNNQRGYLANMVQTLAMEKEEKETQVLSLTEEEEQIQKNLSDINKAISELSQQQQSLLAQKSGDFSASLGDSVETDDPTSSINFNPGFSPAFAAFSYGAYTHYRGMSQYGAKGRAEAGQSYKDIIKHYYGHGVKEEDNFPNEVEVEGHGKLDFQYYLYGLAEMPANWPMDALKAQAIAGRTYAYRYYKAGKPICTTQSCQVFLKSKADNPPDRWKSAVDETKGVIINGDTHAMYSSTTGGYLEDSGWDGGWPNDAYEKRGGSPWFYKAWYTQTYRTNSDKCGLSHPWLNEKEMADILNAWVLWKNNKNTDRISPITTGCWGGNPYSIDEMAREADKLGEKYDKVHNVSVSYSNNGRTSNVRFETNRGTVNIEGHVFRQVFNLRASGYIAIRSRLYDIVKK